MDRNIWTTVAGLRVYARADGPVRAGREPPIVLVHGLGMSGRYMEPAADRLAEHHRVYIVDLPGSGRSQRPEHRLGLSGLADRLAAWMRAVRIDRAVFIGHSMGARIVVRLAERHAAGVERAILVGPPPAPARGGLLPQMARLLLDVPREPPSLLRLAIADYLRAGPRRMIDLARGAGRIGEKRRLERMEAPVLIVRGARDPVCTAEWVRRMASPLPRSRVVTVPGAGHSPHYSHCDAFVGHVRAFLRGDGS